MQIEADGLRLEVIPRSAFDAESWARIDIRFAVPSVSGAYESWLMRGFLESFIADLEAMSAALAPDSSAELSTFEADYRLSMKVGALGHIGGEYEFAPAAGGGPRARVSGTFLLDQSYLPGIIRDFKVLLDSMSRGSL